MAEENVHSGPHTYHGDIPIADAYIGAMLSGQERRGQGSDFVHEYMRIGAAERQGKMSQSGALALDIAKDKARSGTE